MPNGPLLTIDFGSMHAAAFGLPAIVALVMIAIGAAAAFAFSRRWR
jgi:hypothetical protein